MILQANILEKVRTFYEAKPRGIETLGKLVMFKREVVMVYQVN